MGDSEGLSLSLSEVARACALMGDSERALANAHEGLRVSESHGATTFRGIALFAVGEALTEAGRYGEAIDILVTGLGIVRTLRVAPATESILQRNLADARLGAGEVTLAREAADGAIELATRHGVRLCEPGAHLARARALLASEGAAAAGEIAAALAAAADAVEATGARLYTPFIHVERAALARLRDDEPTRQRELTEAHRLFTAIGARARAESVARELSA